MAKITNPFASNPRTSPSSPGPSPLAATARQHPSVKLESAEEAQRAQAVLDDLKNNEGRNLAPTFKPVEVPAPWPNSVPVATNPTPQAGGSKT
jgi:hypothetical protein